MTPRNKPNFEATTKKALGNFNDHLKLRPKKRESNSPKYADSELCQIMSEIFNISEDKIFENIDLFKNINRQALNALFYLSKIKTKQGLISATSSLEFVYNFNKGIDDYLISTPIKIK
ncbi:MAG: hypothetical protein V4612_06255 [Pseudomonadota bacterium]